MTLTGARQRCLSLTMLPLVSDNRFCRSQVSDKHSAASPYLEVWAKGTTISASILEVWASAVADFSG